MHFPRWAFPAAAALIASGTVLSACGQGSGSGRHAAAPKGRAAADPPARPSPSAAPTVLEVAGVTELGKVVTDGQGRTLYRFDADTAKPSASTCTGACARAWPPVQASAAATRVDGVTASLVGKVRRPDGKWQVTLNGWPLYRYAKDRSPGDVKGQGVGKKWYAAAPTGKKAVALAAPKKTAGKWKGWTVVKAKKDAKFGTLLTDGNGRTLYRYDKDTAKPPNSTCFGACKKAWPPAVFNGWKHLKLDGVSKKLVGFIERKDDGKCQLTINGWPMYFYEKDTRPGDTKGQGVGGVWWLTRPSGARVMKSAGSGGGSGGSGSGGGSGYGTGGGY